MTDFSVFLDSIRDWIVRPDFDDQTVTSFVRMAEAALTRNMRVKEMEKMATAIVVDNKVALPVDYIEMCMVLPVGGKPLTFKSKLEFYSTATKNPMWYTIIGGNIVFGAPIEAVSGYEVSIDYFASIPAFSADATWLYSNYYDIFLQACCAAAAAYGQEYDKASSINAMVNEMVGSANEQFIRGKTSGSHLNNPRARMRL